ncbi:MAG: hypothetical protein ACLFWB_04165, partial [Armatimonadota bacterium]
WHMGTGGEASMDWEDGVVHCHCPKAKDTAWLNFFGPVEVQEDVFYRVCTRAKLNDVAGDGGRVLVEWQDETGEDKIYRYPIKISGTSDFTEYSQIVKFPVGAAAISLVRVGIYQSRGEAWFDSVSIRRVHVAEERLMPIKDRWLLQPRDIEVTSVVDVTEQMSAEEFWNRFPDPPQAPAVEPENLYDVDLLRYYFFGLDFQYPARTLWREKRTMRVVDMLGKDRPPSEHKYTVAIAEDIKHRPLIRNYGALQPEKMYPRRMHQWADYYLTSYWMTEMPWFLGRGLDMVNYMQYSQYGPEGHNEFLADYYPEYLEEIKADGRARQWAGGYDYLFDFTWEDGYGYTWQLHQPDHHVNSGMAVWQIRAYETTGLQRYLDSARSEIVNLPPHYGFHSGEWNGQTYYWTEYNPTGENNPTTDATDNIQSLVAQTAAAVGYYTKDQKLLEFARGLLWYMCREWHRDGRWYYHGMENDMYPHRSVSHDEACVSSTMTALPYLLAAGVDVEAMLPYLQEAVAFYFTETETKKILGRKYPRYDFPYFRAYLLFGNPDNLAPGERLELNMVVQVVGTGAADVTLHPNIPEGFTVPDDAQITVSYLDGQNIHQAPLTADAFESGVELDLPIATGDLYRLTYAVVCPEDFEVVQAEYDPNEMPPTNPTFPRPQLTFTDEFGRSRQAEAQVQSFDTLGTITAENFAEFPGTIHFPHADLRLNDYPSCTQPQ